MERRRGAIRGAAVVGGWTVTVVGVTVLVFGWGLGMEAARRPFPIGSEMTANAALGLGLLGLALLLRIRGDVPVERKRAAALTCVIVILVAGTTIFQDLVNADLSIDQLVASAPRDRVNPGRMAPSTAFSLLLLALSILTIDGRRWLTVAPTLAALVVGFVAGSGYVLGIEGLYGVGKLTGMAAHTAVSVVLLSSSILLSRPDREPAIRLSWHDSGGTVARVLTPLVAGLFLAFTWVLTTVTHRRGGSIPAEALLLDNVLLTSFLVILVWHLAGVLHRSERQRREVAEQAMRDRDRFMASVGHELRTPVSALVGFADLLAGMGADLPREERDPILEMMARQGSDLVALLEDLLVAARSDTGSLSAAEVRVDLRAQTAQALEGLSGEVPPVTEVVVGGGVHVVADPLRVRQILRNLLSNAARYGGDRVRVVIGEDEEWGWVRIEDDGPGISPEATARVFEPYVTLHGEAGRPGSVGLGMPVARNLAIRMGGDLEYNREEGWTVFRVTFPRYREESPVRGPERVGTEAAAEAAASG